MVFVPYLLILSREFNHRIDLLLCQGKTLAAEKIGKIKTVIQLLCISLVLGQLAMEADGNGFLAQNTMSE